MPVRYISCVKLTLRTLTAATLSLVLTAVLTTGACTWHLDPDPPKHAVVFGISEYVGGLDPGEQPNLQYSDRDAEAMAALFERSGYDSVDLSVNEEAIRERLNDLLDAASETVKRDDLFVFYFSGHGLRIDQLNQEHFPDLEIDGDRTEYILPADAISNGSSGVEIHLDKAISPSWLDRKLRRIPARRKVVIIDACHAGGFVGSGRTVDLVPDDYQGGFFGWAGNMSDAVGVYLQSPSQSGIKPSTAVVLAATGAAEYAWEPKDADAAGVAENGLFTAALLDGARNGDRNGDGRITVIELYDYIVENMTLRVQLGGGETDWFHPRVSGGAVDFVLF